MKPGEQQRSKQRCQDLCWKVHDRAHRCTCQERFQWWSHRHAIYFKVAIKLGKLVFGSHSNEIISADVQVVGHIEPILSKNFVRKDLYCFLEGHIREERRYVICMVLKYHTH